MAMIYSYVPAPAYIGSCGYRIPLGGRIGDDGCGWILNNACILFHNDYWCFWSRRRLCLFYARYTLVKNRQNLIKHNVSQNDVFQNQAKSSNVYTLGV